MVSLSFFRYQLLMILTICSIHGEALIVYDCWKTDGQVAAISLKEVANCPDLAEAYKETTQTIQVLQQNSFSKIHVYTCLIEVTRQIYHCGMFSHVSVVQNGFLSYIFELTAEECRNLHANKALNLYGTHLITGLKPNSSTHQSVVFAGSLNENGACEASTFTQFGQTFEDVVVQATITITLQDYTALLKLEENLVSLRGGLTCPFLIGSCMDTMNGITTWDVGQVRPCTENDISVLYEGQASFITVTSPNSEQQTTYVVVEQFEHIFALQLLQRTGICMQEVFTTEHPQLLVVTRKTYGFKFSANQPRLTENANLLSYINSKFMYVEVTYKKQLNSVYRNAIHRRCLLNREILKNRLLLAPLNPNAVALLLKNEPGHLGSILGEVMIITKCTARVATIKRMNKCYKQLPVSVDNQTFFVAPVTHILQRIGEEINCGELAAPMFQIDNKWVGFNPNPQAKLTPIILSPEQEKIFNFSFVNLGKSGIYSYDEIKGLQDVLMFGVEREAILNVVVRKLSNLSTDNQGLMPTLLFDEQELQKLAETTLTVIWQKFLQFGTIFSAIYGLYFLYKLIKYVLSLGLHALTLYTTFGISWKLLASCCSSASILLLQKENLQNRKTQSDDENPVLVTETNSTTLKSNRHQILTSPLLVDSSFMHRTLQHEQSKWV